MTATAVKKREAGVLSASTNEEWDLVARKAQALAKSSVIPSDYRDKPENVLVAMELAERTGIPILACMQNLFIINGRPSWSSQFLIASVNRSGRFSPLRFRFEGTEGGEDWGCRAVAVDRGDGEELVGALITMKMAKDEGWSTKSGSKWRTMPEQMLRYRAAAFWARVYSPELAVGLHTAEESEDIGPSQADRVRGLAAALDRGDVPVTTVVEEDPDAPAEDVDSPATSGEIEKLKQLIDKCDVDVEEAGRLHGLMDNEDGPGVRTAIKNLQKRAISVGGGEDGELGL